MVLLCEKEYPTTHESTYQKEFQRFPFELSPFQKWSLEAIIKGHHSLITAHTGSGKTLPAEFAIQYFTERGKKVIYTSPLKALSNQKLYDFREKYPHISFGILTGDCKDNPEADVLIMTTEILRNTLFKKKLQQEASTNTTDTSTTPMSHPQSLHFDMDIERELACVVFDEVHYISDEHRGSVWEQSILLLPSQVQMVMLSATISKPENFAQWIETNRSTPHEAPQKEVYISSTNVRVVPLTHYSWITCPKSKIRSIQDKKMKQQVEDTIDTFIPLKIHNQPLDEKNYHKTGNVIKYFQKERFYMKRSFVLNTLVKQLYDNGMLPAICFVFSRKHVEKCAKEISMSLFDPEKESKYPADVKYECEQMLRRKLTNAEEYLNLPEYKDILSLLQKGIAIHHAGIMPILREMIEMLFEKRYVRLLFATETFAVGINMPTKTVVFAGLTKFNGSTMRMLLSHEYTQMAGRAGRRNLDKVGHVVHCNNLFDYPTPMSYRSIMMGKPKTLTSKFKISYHLVLNILSQYMKHPDRVEEKKEEYEQRNSIQHNMVDACYRTIEDFSKKSLVESDISKELKQFQEELFDINTSIANKEASLARLKTPLSVLDEYHQLIKDIAVTSNKKQKKMRRKVDQIDRDYKNLHDDYKKVKELEKMKEEAHHVEKLYEQTSSYLKNNIKHVLEILYKNRFVDAKMTEKGIVASSIQEANPLVFGDIYEETRGFRDFTSQQIVGFLSCFTNIRLSDELKLHEPDLGIYGNPNSNPTNTNNTTTNLTNTSPLYVQLKNIRVFSNKYMDDEATYHMDSGADYDYHYDMVEIVMKWWDAENEEECISVIQEAKKYDVSIGEFIKMILKINTLVVEMQYISEQLGNIELLHKLEAIPNQTLKYIVTNQSLYI